MLILAQNSLLYYEIIITQSIIVYQQKLNIIYNMIMQLRALLVVGDLAFEQYVYV